MRSLAILLTIAAIGLGTWFLLPRESTQESRVRFILSQEFPNDADAIAHGREVLKLLRSADADAAKRLNGLIGSRVAFLGGRGAKQGPRPNSMVLDEPSPNLMLADGIMLNVKLVPEGDVIPEAVLWSAAVIGTLKRVDMSTKTIFIQARPEDWHCGETS
jgi:hypothetical protein